jgi:hypothetical protein
MHDNSATATINPFQVPSERPRTIKVTTLWRVTARGGRESCVPFIRISGKWLAALGFTANSRVIIKGEPGRLTMTILTHAAQANTGGLTSR